MVNQNSVLPYLILCNFHQDFSITIETCQFGNILTQGDGVC